METKQLKNITCLAVPFSQYLWCGYYYHFNSLCLGVYTVIERLLAEPPSTDDISMYSF